MVTEHGGSLSKTLNCSPGKWLLGPVAVIKCSYIGLHVQLPNPLYSCPLGRRSFNHEDSPENLYPDKYTYILLDPIFQDIFRLYYVFYYFFTHK